MTGAGHGVLMALHSEIQDSDPIGALSLNLPPAHCLYPGLSSATVTAGRRRGTLEFTS